MQNPLDLPLHIVLAGWMLRRLLPIQTPKPSDAPVTLLVDDMYEGETCAMNAIYQGRKHEPRGIVAKFLDNIIEQRRKKLAKIMTQLWLARIDSVVIVPFKEE